MVVRDTGAGIAHANAGCGIVLIGCQEATGPRERAQPAWR